MPLSEIRRMDPGLEIHPSETLDGPCGSMGFGWTPSADQPARRPLDPPWHGGRVMAAAELSGSLLGIPVRLTPGNVVTVLLKLLNSLTPTVPVTMTNVTTDDFLVASDSLQANGLTITSG